MPPATPAAAGLDPSEIDGITATAAALAEAARQATLAHFRADGLFADNKETHRFDPVTVADRESETRMREILAARRPDDAIYGEEFGAVAGTSGLTWVLDPIDGTRGFLSGTPTWGVLIAVSDAEGPVYGLIDQPYIGERFAGGFGKAELAGPLGVRPLKTRPARPLSEAILFTTFPEVGTEEEGAAFDRVKAVRRQNLDLTRRGQVLALLALEAGDGYVDLLFAGGATVRLDVDAILCHAEDFDEPWPTQWRPEHPTDEAAPGKQPE